MEKNVPVVIRTTTSQRLIKTLESLPIGYHLSIYLDKKFIDEIFIDYLKLIARDKRFKSQDVRNSTSVISASIKLLITKYMQFEKRKILQKTQTAQIKEIQENNENDNFNENEEEELEDETSVSED